MTRTPPLSSALRKKLPALLAAAVALAPLPAAAQSASVLVPPEPELPVKSYILIDALTGSVVAKQAPDLRVPVASLTKMMTSYVVVDQAAQDQLDMQSDVPISVKAWSVEGSRMFVREGTRVPLLSLLRGVAVQSGNDASVALAEHVGGSEAGFVDLMNVYASRLGMDNTRFANATGLPVDGEESAFSTAADLSILARRLIYDHPEHYEEYAVRSFTYNGVTQSNRNGLLWLDESVDGIKTGHTEEAGYCLVSSAQRRGMRLIAVLLGAATEAERNTYSRRLLEYGFRHFSTRTVLDAGEVLREVPLWAGVREQVALGPLDAVRVTLPRAYLEDLQVEVVVEEDVIAPKRRGDKVGVVRVRHEDSMLAEVDLVVLEDAADAGMFSTVISYIELFMHRLLGLD